MASDKKPSIYSDRSTIGSSDELDEYGVWVKSEPQNFSSIDEGGEADAVSSVPDFDSGPDDESLDSELAGLDLPDLEVPDESVVVADEADTFDSFESDTLGTLDDTSLEDASFDDFSIPEDDAVMNTNIDLKDNIGLDSSVDLEDSIGLDDGIDHEAGAAQDDSISVDESINLEDSIGLDDGIDLEAGADLEDIGFEDSISLDDGLNLDDSINLDDGIDLEDGTGLDNGLNLDDSISLDDSIDFDFPSAEEEPARDSVFDSSEETPFEDAGFTEVAMDDFMDETPAELSAEGAAHTQAHTQSDLSTQLLMKIAEELSSIRTELTNLKKEFAGIRAETSAEEKEKGEGQHGGFFNEEEDEKIALTGDELDNILTTADFTEEAGEDATEELEGEFSFPEAEDDTSSGPFQVSDESVTDLEPMADEAGIPDILSEQDDIIGIEDQTDEHIDISAESDDLVLDRVESDDLILDQVESDDLIMDQVDNFTPTFDNTDIKDAEYLEETDDSFDSQPEDAEDIETAIGDIEGIGDIEDIEDISALVAPVDSEELQELRENGAVHMTPAPEDTTYLDEEPLSDSVADDISPELPPEDGVPDTLDLDDSFEIQIEESAPEIQEDELPLSAGEEFPDGQAVDETSSDETSFEEASIGLSQTALDELEHPSGISEITVQEPSFDVLNDMPADADADIEISEKEPPSVPDEGDSLDQVIPEGFVVVDDGETPVPFDDELEMEEAEALEDLDDIEEIKSGETDDHVSGEAFNIPADSTDSKSEYPDTASNIPVGLKSELKVVLSYMDQLLESLPEEKIQEFAKSEYFDTYKKLFKELGLA